MTETNRRRRLPLLELLVLFGLPLAVVIAGVLLVQTARQQGFTEIDGSAVAPKGH